MNPVVSSHSEAIMKAFLPINGNNNDSPKFLFVFGKEVFAKKATTMILSVAKRDMNGES